MPKARVKLASKMVAEAKRLVKKGDPVQASEKLYKAAEEAVKALAKAHRLPEHVEAERRGRWTAPLLFFAAQKLSEKIDRRIRYHWDSAWLLHVEGFHEARLPIRLVKARIKDVEELLELAE